jgi:ABC-2 type transport system ATP-binding protein
MEMILEVNGLCKQYKKSDFALKNVTFSIPKGSIMGFVGENGAGKTTTINCIMNILIKDQGEIKIFGREMTDNDIEIRNDIGVVFDANSFGSYMNAKKVASVMRTLYTNWDDNLFASYLKKFKLSEKQEIKKYSRGMTMKLGLAVALSHHPKFLILDEATAGLDPIVRDEILDIFLEFVQDENHSILLSSHITTDLEKIADYITFIHEGEIILTCKKDDLIYNYGIMRLKSSQFEKMDSKDIIAYRKRGHQIDVLIEDTNKMKKEYQDFVIDEPSIEEIMLIIVKGEKHHVEN